MNKGIVFNIQKFSIHDFNDSTDDAKDLAQLLFSVGAKQVRLLPFHQFDEKNYELLNQKYLLKNKKALHPKDLKNYQQIFLDEGIECFL